MNLETFTKELYCEYVLSGGQDITVGAIIHTLDDQFAVVHAPIYEIVPKVMEYMEGYDLDIPTFSMHTPRLN